ncbi:MAG TPA: TonB-dependent receptor [Methylophilaceae bacterium]|nr:TonB-dependent receptor [Methylophilaceae bacterium]
MASNINKNRPALHFKAGSLVRTAVVAAAALKLNLAVAADPADVTRDFALMSLEELSNIQVTSVSRTPERILDAPASVTVITSEDIRRSGATSIPEALRLAPNLNVAQKNSHDWAISARGFNTDLANKMLVMIDGRTVYSPLFSGVFWDKQDYLLEDIERIEVISGPGGTLWGVNAVNGVINIITKSSSDTQGAYFETGVGDELKNSTAVRYGGELAPNVTYRVYGKHFDRDDQVYANGNSANDAWRMGQGGFRLDADADALNSFTLQGDYYDGEESDPITGNDGVARGNNILGRWKHVLSDDSDFSLQMYYDRTHLEIPRAAAPAPLVVPAGFLTDDLETYDVDFQHRFKLDERNRIVWGLGYRYTHDRFDSAPTVVLDPEHLDQQLYSAFIQDEIKLHDKLFFTVGTKVEHTDYTGWEYEPSARIQWQVAPDQMLWAAISRAVRTPSRLDRDLRTPTNLPAPFPQSILSGSSDFDSETVVAYELGYRGRLGPKFSTSATAFYNEYDHVRSLSASPPGFLGLGLPFFFANNLEGQTHGIELSADYQALSWWRLQFGYSYLEENIHVKSGATDINNALNETADPRHQVSLRSLMDLPYNMELDGQLRWVDELHLNNAGVVAKVPSYTELSVRLGWRPTKRVELSLTGQNVLHDSHPEYGLPSSQRVEIERSIYGKVQLRF